MTISAGQFKAQCLKIMDDVKANNSSVIVTKYGKPVAKLIAFHPAEEIQLFGSMKDEIQVNCDIIAPIGESWDADN